MRTREILKKLTRTGERKEERFGVENAERVERR